MTLRLRIRLVEGFGFSQRALRFGFVAVAICAMMLASPLWGQNTFPASGNVGIGTTTPNAKLSLGNNVYTAPLGSSYGQYQFLLYDGGNASLSYGLGIEAYNIGFNSYGGYKFYHGGGSTPLMVIGGNGSTNVGIGTTAPVATLDVVPSTLQSGIRTGGAEVQSYAVNNSWYGENMYYNSGAGGWIRRSSGYGTVLQMYSGNFYFETFPTGAAGSVGTQLNVMMINNNGNVGIGTTTPVHPLQVAGIIGAEEVVVSSTGADYVFKPDYRLSPLTEVAAYIEQNHHLPGIPSEKEVQAQGVNLGEMQTKLLAKIEELTLHMIQAERENQELR